MKICLYSPYFPTHFGGGEKYLLDVAQVLATKHEVSMAISSQAKVIDEGGIKQAYENFFQVDLSRISLIATPLGTPTPWWRKLAWTAQFDVMYYLTDGSLFFSLARKNILHIQIPFTAPKKGLVERLKLANWSVKNTNSNFTRQFIQKAWQTKIDEVHYPMVEVSPKLSLEQLQHQKQKIILNVGRFFRQLHAKRQDVLVTIFQDLCRAHPEALKGWKLVLAGGVEDQVYAKEVHALAEGLPVEFYHELNRSELDLLYQQASIYWHAAGYEIDEAKNPEKVEHFGITTVEAMAHAVAPVVIGKGGQKEVLGSALQQWLWQTAAECQELSFALVSQPKLLSQVQAVAQNQAQTFDRQTFSQTLWRMLK